MARVLVISSQVASGQVGGGVTGFVLQRLGHETVFLPTVLLSNSPDQDNVAGEFIAVDLLRKMIDVYVHSGRLNFDAVFIGYLPSPEHVAFAVQTIDQCQRANAGLTVCIDPIMGDDMGGEDSGALYIEEETAQAIRDDLAPLANVITPNRFELGWLSGGPVHEQDAITKAAAELAAPTVLVTSAVQDEVKIGTYLYSNKSGRLLERPYIADPPKGTGDFVSALFAGHILAKTPVEEAYEHTVDAVAHVMNDFAGRAANDHCEAGLAIIAAQSVWARRIPK